MMKFLTAVLLSLGCLAVFAGAAPKPTSAVFVTSSAEFKTVENGGACDGRIVKTKKGAFRGQNFYFRAKSGDWEERKLVLMPLADGKITFSPRAPNGAVAEFKSFKIDGEEKLTAPLIQPYSKNQSRIKFNTAMTKDKEMVVTFQIRKSEKTPADFADK